MATVSQESVVAWLRCHLGLPADTARGKDNRGPDLVWRDGSGIWHVEAIAFSDRTASGVTKRGKNQSDLWKAFSQAISRLNPESEWGRADRVAIAVPAEFLEGWSYRVKIIGSSIWQRIGQAFPELQMWFVSPTTLIRLAWNDTAFLAHPEFQEAFRLLNSGRAKQLTEFLATTSPEVKRIMVAMLDGPSVSLDTPPKPQSTI